MFTPVTALRRWFRSDVRSVAVNPFRSIAPRPRSRPVLLTLEDRLAPGSLLGELIAAALSGAAPPAAPLDRLPAEPFGMAPTVQRLRIEGPDGADEAPRPAELMGPAEVEQRGWAADALPAPAGVRVAGLDDDLVFLAAPQPGLRTTATDGAPGMKSAPPVAVEPGAAFTSRSVPGGSGAPPGTDSTSAPASFLLRPSSVRSAAPAAPADATSAPNDSNRITPAPAHVRRDAPAGATPSGASGTLQYVADLPPNAVPVATDDPAVVPEDGGSVVIDVLANDTDADGTPLRIDWWDWKPAKGTVFLQDDNTLKYVPFEDAEGTDTFEYIATDTRDVSNKAKVTVTITPNNDKPQAFNDALRFVHPPSPSEIMYSPVDTGVSVLTNDTDVEQPIALKVLDISPFLEDGKTPMVGKITMDKDTGTFTWTGPGNFTGTTSFAYRTVDGQGEVSDPARVKLWAFTAPFGSTPTTANTDWVAVGDNPVSANVLANDVGGSVAVLASRPPAKRVTQFGSNGGFDGALKYDPGPAPDDLDVFLTYRIFNTIGTATATAKINMAAVNLELFNGQEKLGQPAVRTKNEWDVGAFTVVNTNDTDGKGGYDNKQTGPILGGDPGENEKDLMRLRVNKPTGYMNGQKGEEITVEVTSGKARFFVNNLRQTDLGTSITPITTFVEAGVDKQYLDYWVDVYEPANTVRSITITMTYKGQPETVKATGVWVNFNNPGGFHITGKNRAPDADQDIYKKNFDTPLGKHPNFELGLPGPLQITYTDPQTKKVVFTRVSQVNPVEFEFTATPTGIWKEPGVRFDVSRSIEARRWAQAQGQGISEVTDAKTGIPAKYPVFREQSNDDWADINDNVPNL